MNAVTTAQINNIMLDTGVVYIDYGQVGERVLAPTRGGSNFTVEQDVREIERDGALGKEKGLRRVIKENAMLTVKFMDMSVANLNMMLRGSTLNSVTISSTETGTIASSEYFTNVTWIGTDMEGKNKVITLFNAMSDNGLKADFTDKDESVLEVVFSAHRDPTDSTPACYTIVEVEDPSPDLTGLSVTTATLSPAFVGTTYEYVSTVVNGTTSVTVTPTCATADSITVNGTTVVTAQASGNIALATGVNVITVRTLKAGKTTTTYTIRISRASS
ncbi:MAG: hypothetical protein RLZZ577_103 [Bacteroidota bacterium]|jgi:hypothetical protein